MARWGVAWVELISSRPRVEKLSSQAGTGSPWRDPGCTRLLRAAPALPGGSQEGPSTHTHLGRQVEVATTGGVGHVYARQTEYSLARLFKWPDQTKL